MRARILDHHVWMAIATVVLLAAFTRRPPDAIQAQRVELVDVRGNRQAVLAADSTGLVLTLFNTKGRATASLRFNDAPRLMLLGGTGREVAELGAPRAQHLVQ